MTPLRHRESDKHFENWSSKGMSEPGHFTAEHGIVGKEKFADEVFLLDEHLCQPEAVIGPHLVKRQLI